MRFLLVLVGIAALILVVAMALGFVSINQTKTVELPRIEGGSGPAFDAEVGKIDVGMQNRTVEVPTVTTTERTISVPSLSVERPGNSAQAQ